MGIKELYSFGMNKKPSKKENRAVPICQAIVVCDNIIREEHTRKLSLMGLFNSIKATTFPIRHAKMHIYIALTDYKGDAEATLKFLNPEGEELAKLSGPLRFANKLSVLELNFVINGMVFPKPGAYTIEFLVNDQLVVSRDIQVIEPPKRRVK
ncbi:hypothetical protein KAX21_07490 [candidate division WOR-3 bacterium]|nr:hypothetical protein [candidate division WOR-3 bacterium]